MNSVQRSMGNKYIVHNHLMIKGKCDTSQSQRKEISGKTPRGFSYIPWPQLGNIYQTTAQTFLEVKSVKHIYDLCRLKQSFRNKQTHVRAIPISCTCIKNLIK